VADREEAGVMPIYPLLAVAALGAVIVLELLVFRSGIFRCRTYWIAMAIIIGFMILIDGWLTKLSAPIVIYDDTDTSGLRPVWDILLEEYAYAVALVTLVILLWDHQRPQERDAAPTTPTFENEAQPA
jgi:lycopene cyclase domain-containing protein